MLYCDEIDVSEGNGIDICQIKTLSFKCAMDAMIY